MDFYKYNLDALIVLKTYNTWYHDLDLNCHHLYLYMYQLHNQLIKLKTLL